jgi:hypothetical protein
VLCVVFVRCRCFNSLHSTSRFFPSFDLTAFTSPNTLPSALRRPKQRSYPVIEKAPPAYSTTIYDYSVTNPTLAPTAIATDQIAVTEKRTTQYTLSTTFKVGSKASRLPCLFTVLKPNAVAAKSDIQPTHHQPNQTNTVWHVLH